MIILRVFSKIKMKIRIRIKYNKAKKYLINLKNNKNRKLIL